MTNKCLKVIQVDTLMSRKTKVGESSLEKLNIRLVGQLIGSISYIELPKTSPKLVRVALDAVFIEVAKVY